MYNFGSCEILLQLGISWAVVVVFLSPLPMGWAWIFSLHIFLLVLFPTAIFSLVSFMMGEVLCSLPPPFMLSSTLFHIWHHSPMLHTAWKGVPLGVVMHNLVVPYVPWSLLTIRLTYLELCTWFMCLYYLLSRTGSFWITQYMFPWFIFCHLLACVAFTVITFLFGAPVSCGGPVSVALCHLVCCYYLLIYFWRMISTILTKQVSIYAGFVSPFWRLTVISWCSLGSTLIFGCTNVFLAMIFIYAFFFHIRNFKVIALCSKQEWTVYIFLLLSYVKSIHVFYFIFLFIFLHYFCYFVTCWLPFYFLPSRVFWVVRASDSLYSYAMGVGLPSFIYAEFLWGPLFGLLLDLFGPIYLLLVSLMREGPLCINLLGISSGNSWTIIYPIG